MCFLLHLHRESEEKNLEDESSPVSGSTVSKKRKLSTKFQGLEGFINRKKKMRLQVRKFEQGQDYILSKCLIELAWNPTVGSNVGELVYKNIHFEVPAGFCDMLVYNLHIGL